jgi:hypothetical protein
MIDIVLQTPARFSAAVKTALEHEMPSLRPTVVRSRFDLREKGPEGADTPARGVICVICGRGAAAERDSYPAFVTS